MNYIVPAFLIIFIFVAFDSQAYVSEQNFPGLVTLLILYGCVLKILSLIVLANALICLK